MSNVEQPNNPFKTGKIYNGHVMYYCSAVDRIKRVKEFGADECRAAMALQNLQTTVRSAVYRRLRQLDKTGVEATQ